MKFLKWFTRTVAVEVKVDVEKVVRETVLGTPVPVELFEAYKTTFVIVGFVGHDLRTTLGYYRSCESALKAHPDASVRAVRMWKAGDIYLSSLSVVRVKEPVEPKPRAKGFSA